jgi:hypothetical protein
VPLNPFIEPLESRRLLSTTIAQKVLFIRGGSGTGGFLEGGADEQLADINNGSTAAGNHGWKMLADALRGAGFEPEQMIEGPAANNTPINLAGLDLSRYRAIVFGSNNADYTTAQVNALDNFIRTTGGGALFISDANFGRNWRDAADSDQEFLARFGLVMNQDLGVYTLDRAGGDFVNGSHPILDGVDTFDGEGVSPIVITGPAPAGVTRARVVAAKNQTRNNDGTNSADGFLGSVRDVDSGDGSLVIATAGAGRVAGHFDRNTFFNTNGAGTSISRFDNRTYALNLFKWLAYGDPESTPPALVSSNFAFETAPTAVQLQFSEDVSPSLSTSDFTVTNLTTGATLPAGDLSLSWDRATNTAAVEFINAPTGLPDGDWRLSAAAGSIADPFGNTLSAAISFDFFVFAGDADRNRVVNIQDFAILASNFNLPGVFSDGDFNYSGTVNINDFAILAGKFNEQLASELVRPFAKAGSSTITALEFKALSSLFLDGQPLI